MIEAERLLLRQWQDSDLLPFAQLNANAHVMRHFPSTLSRTASDALVHRLGIAIDDNGHGFYAVERKSDGVLLVLLGQTKVALIYLLRPA